MYWLIPALAAPFFWAGSNLIDERLVKQSIRDTAALVMFAGAFLSLPAVYVTITGQWTLPPASTIFLAIAGGGIGLLVYFPYYKALKSTAPSHVMLMWNLSPVLIVGLAHFGVNERLEAVDYLAIVLLTASSAIAAFTATGGRIFSQPLAWMGLASIMLAVSSTIEKGVYDKLSFLSGLAWLSTGTMAATLFVGVCFREERRRLLASFRGRVARVMILNEGLDLAALLSLNLATSLAPVSIVHAVGGIQPVFILLIGCVFKGDAAGTPAREWARVVVASGLAAGGLGLIHSSI